MRGGREEDWVAHKARSQKREGKEARAAPRLTTPFSAPDQPNWAAMGRIATLMFTCMRSRGANA